MECAAGEELARDAEGRTHAKSHAPRLLDEQPRAPEADDHGITDLLIQGLLDRLPKPNAIWSLEDRAKWLRTAASIFGLVYKSNDGDQRELGVVLLKPDAGNPSMTEAIVTGFIGQ